MAINSIFGYFIAQQTVFEHVQWPTLTLC